MKLLFVNSCISQRGKACLLYTSVEHVINELGRFSPAEAVVNDGAYSEKALIATLTEKFRCRVENGGEGRFRLAEAEKNIRRQFGEEAFDRLPRTNPAAAMALGGLLHLSLIHI